MCKTFHEKIFEKMHFFSKTGAPYSIYFLPTKYIFTRSIIAVHPFPNVKRAAAPPGNSSSTKLKKQLGSFARKETSCFPTTILSSASPAPRLARSGRGRYRFRLGRRVGRSPCLRSAGSRPCARSGHRLALASAGRTAWRR